MFSSAAIDSPWPGPTATATRPEVAIRRSASSVPRPLMAPAETSITSGAASMRASSGISLLRPRRLAARLAAAGDCPGPLQIGVVVDLDPVNRPDGRGEHRAAPPGELGEAVLVVQARVTPPGGLESVGQPDRPRGRDPGHAPVLAAR